MLKPKRPGGLTYVATPTPIGGRTRLAVLCAVRDLGDLAYGLQIRRHISKQLDFDFNQAQVYATLQSLKANDLVSSRLIETMDAGRRTVRSYTLTSEGKKALTESGGSTTEEMHTTKSPAKRKRG